MDLEQGLKHALDGNALLFVGAGFSLGATNLTGAPFLRGGQLATHFATKAGLPASTGLEDAAEEFLEQKGEDALIRELQQLFTTKKILPHHRELAKVPWSRIYTTNYDNVLETAYVQESKKLYAIAPDDRPATRPIVDTMCIHFNGYVDRLDRDTVLRDLRLTESSYLNSSLTDSPWAMLFRNDIRAAQAIFFVGYSLFDFDIKRVLFASEETKEKTLFFLGNTPDDATVRRANRFGSPLLLTTQELMQQFKPVTASYSPIDKTVIGTLSLKEVTKPANSKALTDRAFHDLLLFGHRSDGLISESINASRTYFLERTATQKVFDLIDNGQKVIAICSDLGNGKSVFLEGLRLKAIEKGFRVFNASEHSDEVKKEVEAIAKISNKVILTIEEYQGWLDEIRHIGLTVGKQIILLVTARKTVHDIIVDDLAQMLGKASVPEITLDILDDLEIKWFRDAFNEYGLFGEWAGKTPGAKDRFLKNQCKGQIHSILLKLLESPSIAKRLDELVQEIKKSQDHLRIVTSVLILTIINHSPTIDDLVDFWGTEALSTSSIKSNSAIRQLLDLGHSRIVVRSSVVAEYILKNLIDSSVVVSVLTRMTTVADSGARVSVRHRGLFRKLTKFSNVQLVLPADGRGAAVMAFFESIKNLPGCNRYPLFWLQYAIASLVIEDLFRSEKYFKTAYSLAEERDFDTFQIDNHFARFLLKQAVELLDKKPAMANFRKARKIILRQLENDRLHYPFRVSLGIEEFLEKFGDSLVESELMEIKRTATKVLESGQKLDRGRLTHHYIRDSQNAMTAVITKCGILVAKTKPASPRP